VTKPLLVAGFIVIPLPVIATIYYAIQFPQPPSYALPIGLASLVLGSGLLLPAALFFAKRKSFRTGPIIGLLTLLAALGSLSGFGIATVLQRLPRGSWVPTSPPEAIARFTENSYAFYGMGAIIAQARSGEPYLIQCSTALDCIWSTQTEYEQGLANTPRPPCPSSQLKPYYLPPSLPSPALSKGIVRICDHASDTYIHLALLEDTSVLVWSNPHTSASFWAPFDMTLLGSISGILAGCSLLLRHARGVWGRALTIQVSA